MILELESLLKDDDVFFEIFPRDDQKTSLLVIFFEDSRLDV